MIKLCLIISVFLFVPISHSQGNDIEKLHIDNTVTQKHTTLTANAVGYNYQWLNCNNRISPISGETRQSFTPEINGSYAVEISKNGAVVVSKCIDVIGLSVADTNFKHKILIYPNPTRGDLYINLGKKYKHTTIFISNKNGKVIKRQDYILAEKIHIVLNVPAGTYNLDIKTQSGEKGNFKIVVK